MKILHVVSLAAIAFAPHVWAQTGQLNQLSANEKKDGFRLLFNGKNLDGWDGDPVRWSVQKGVIVGSSDGHPFKVNTFLINKGKFSNFVLKADIKLRNHNSGI